MHYYKRNIGDYSKKAGRLTMLQHGAYTLLLDSCYDRERFPTLDEAIEWTWASTEAEVEAVKFVLSRFFKLDSDGQYVQDRILDELLHYHKNADTNKRIALEREAKRKGKSTNRTPSVNEAPPNQEPLTNNQEPTTKIEKKATVVAAPEGVSPEVWDSFVKQRKAKKAQITDNVMAAIGREAQKAGWSLDAALNEIVVRNWQSFKADWVSDKQNQTETIYQRSMRLKMQEAVPSIAKQAPEPYQDASDFFRTIDMETQKAIEVNK